MANILGVSAITDRIKARITQIEQQLTQHQILSGELERLRSALARLEGEVRSRVNAGRGRRPTSTPKSTAAPTAAAKPKRAAARTPRGQNKAKILEALKWRTEDRVKISKQTGTGTGTASTTLTKTTKAGDIVKAERGYALPQ
jgi:hypothetical protein